MNSGEGEGEHKGDNHLCRVIPTREAYGIRRGTLNIMVI